MAKATHQKLDEEKPERQFPYLAAATSIIVPITVAILGYYGKEIASAQQREIEEAKLRYSYVTMIVDILQKKTDKTDKNIICWSWRNLSAHSKAPFTEDEIRKLCESNATLPDDIQFGATRPASTTVIPPNIDLWRVAKLPDSATPSIKAAVDRILANKARYEEVVRDTSVPWFVIGILHHVETDGNFSTHLHNNDPLAARTVQVPAGRPSTGEPPFTWLESARDVVARSRMTSVDFKDTGKMLDFFERYNGIGYRRRGVSSPYVWGCTDQYRSGRYVTDGLFDPDAVSRQCGAAAYLIYMKNTGVIAADDLN